jgi:hypothetical protein
MLFSKNKRDISYIKIWVEHHGPIPLDKNGRRMEIHHIDGDKTNNNINNLQLLTIEEHFDIHYKQQDYGSCYLIAIRMKKSPEEISDLARQAQLKRVTDGTHHFLGPAMNAKRVTAGTHHWLDGTKSRETQNNLVKSGVHRFVNSDWQKNNQLSLVESGKHNFLGGHLQKSLVKSGKHHFVTSNPGKIQWVCEKCGKEGKGKTNYARWHGENCVVKK